MSETLSKPCVDTSAPVLEDGEEGDPNGLTRPNSILRRSARTRIRKANLPGDGGGHRFASTRRGRRTAAPDIDIPEDDWDGRKNSTNTSDGSAELDSQGHETKESGESIDEEGTRYYDAPQHLEQRRGSDSTDDAGIFDAYRQSRSSSASSESNSYEGTPSNESSPPEKTISLPQLTNLTRPDPADWFQDEGEKTPTQERSMDPLGGLRRTESGPGLSLHLPQDQSNSGLAPSPTSPTTPQQRPAALPSADLPPGMAAPRNPLKPQPSKENIGMVPVNLDTPRPSMTRPDTSASVKEKEKEKEKEKKSGFFSKKDKGKDKDEKKSKKDKDGFLGSLFGGKKKQEEPSPVSNFSADGRAAAAALLGTSKSAKSVGLTGHQTPSPTSPGFSNFARYPIHVERAIYRLSHIKLANARRPLFEQVLISNLMFWYLGVIGRNVAEEKKPASTNGKEGGGGEEKEQKMIAKGTPIKPADSGSAGTALPREPPQQPAPRERKTGLSKPERSRANRDHEAPIKAPSYGSQNAQVEHEVRTATTQVQNMSIKSRPPQASPPPREYQPPQPQHPSHMQGAPQQQRSASQPGPQRAMSPPSPGQVGRSPADAYPVNPKAAGHAGPLPNFQGPPRGAPQSSFGPPPPANGPSTGQPNGPAPPFDDRRQRTMSQPGQAPNHAAPPPGTMRRVVTDGRSPSPHNPYTEGGRVSEHRLPQHAGPQPGQLFQYPGSSPAAPSGGGGPPPPGPPFPQRPQPGQIYSPQPGQVFHHHPQQNQYSPNPQHHRPLPDAGHPPAGWQQPQRLPPGVTSPHQQHPDYAHLNRQPSYPPRDPRQLERPQSMQYGQHSPQPQHQHPPYQPHGIPQSHSQPQGFYQQQPPPRQPGANPQPGQMYAPQQGYGPPPDGYRRQQPVPPAQYGAHHR